MYTFNQIISYEQFQSAITQELAADALIQREYGRQNGQFHGCHVGCTLHRWTENYSDHSEYERLFGIPQVLAHLFDATHEGLEAEDTPAFLAAIRDTIKPNQDLGMVWPQFALWLLADETNPYRLNQHESVAKEVNAVADVYRAWISTGSVDINAAEYAEYAAEYAEYAAKSAESAEYAAKSAAKSAKSAEYAAKSADFWPTVRDKLLQLIADTPVMTAIEEK